MPLQVNLPFLVWAARDILRKPGESLWMSMLLTLFIIIAGVPLLFSEALSRSAHQILMASPSLVIRKMDAGGWSPVASHEILPLVQAVPGVTRARARIWGVARGPLGPVTLVGLDEKMLAVVHSDDLALSQFKGLAIVGPGVRQEGQTLLKIHNGARVLSLKIAKQISHTASMASHDLVLLHPDDVRYLLGLSSGQVTDVAIDVFHDSEQTAIAPDLADILPWPVRIVSRSDILGMYSGAFSFRSGVYLLMLVPAIFALVLIVALSVRSVMGGRYEIGLYKALGWQTRDIVRLQLCRALIISLPAAALGITLACAMVFWSGMTWMGAFFLGWKEAPPEFHLNIKDGAWVMIELVGIVILPYLTGALWAAMKGAAADPLDCLEGKVP